jgi:hypothetical protein
MVFEVVTNLVFDQEQLHLLAHQQQNSWDHQVLWLEHLLRVHVPLEGNNNICFTETCHIYTHENVTAKCYVILITLY